MIKWGFTWCTILLLLTVFLFACTSTNKTIPSDLTETTQGDSMMPQGVYGLTQKDWEQIEQQEKVVLDLVVSNYDDIRFNHTQADLEYIQYILDNNIVQKNQTYELQSLGIVFGQVLVTQTDLEWVIVDDEYGRDPALWYPGTSTLLYPLTMISKRVEQDEPVDVLDMYNWTLEQLQSLPNHTD